MTRLYLLLLTLSLSTFFLFVPDTGPDRYKMYQCPECKKMVEVDTYLLPQDSELIAFFPLNPGRKLFSDTYVFLLFVNVVVVLLAVVILIGETEYVNAMRIYLIIACVDLLFYLLSYGDPFDEIIITWNFCKLLIFGLTVRKAHGYK